MTLFTALRALDAARTLAVDTLAALALLRRAWDALPVLLELADEWAATEPECTCGDDDGPGMAAGHIAGDDCPCGPTAVPVRTESGAVNWVIAHRDLTGEHDPQREADRAAALFEAMEMARKDDE